MNDTTSTVKSRNILVLGASELGMPVLRDLARRAKDIDGAKISVLLRESAVESGDPATRDRTFQFNVYKRVIAIDRTRHAISDGLHDLSPFTSIGYAETG
ncbi:hypothetical protein ACFX59_17220 [Sphingomonas sp. NCPPB 2930]|uniref:hypothetical protein n=1 Tax=Sphingomonas sp. NCPPB 2930 TaxID=3162788 RepID=UPI0036DE72D3